MSKEIIMLGTGNAAAIRCYNTCFLIRNEEALFLVDAGGGNGILQQLDAVDVEPTDIKSMFVTHAHTDHLLGVVWMVRTWAQRINQKRCEGGFRIYGHDRVLEILRTICTLTLPAKLVKQIDKGIFFEEVADGDSFEECGMKFRCFDILSQKEKQFGFRVTFPDQTTLACLGDEPFQEKNREWVEGVDWLMSEAFCLYRDRAEFSPYEKHHSTALDAGRIAEVLGVRNLILYHTEDQTLDERKHAYTAEVNQVFRGRTWVPDDLELIPLTGESGLDEIK